MAPTVGVTASDGISNILRSRQAFRPTRRCCRQLTARRDGAAATRHASSACADEGDN